LPGSSAQSPFSALLAARDQSDLVARIKRRDPQAMGTLYDRYGKAAYALILRILADPSEAEDVLAETFVKVWNQIGSFKDSHGEELGFWILSLARNQSIEHLRATSSVSPNSSALENPLLFRSMPQAAGRGRNPEQVRALGKALAGLEVGERQILELAYFGGLSAPEIAQKLSQPLPKVKKSISAALEKISRAITNG
jgi:RNA polymerase sigma-70 factor, ECF subfamily